MYMISTEILLGNVQSTIYSLATVISKGYYYSEKQEIKALQKEVKNCSEQMEALWSEFKE